MKNFYIFLFVLLVALLGAVNSNAQMCGTLAVSDIPADYGTLLDTAYFPQSEGAWCEFDVKAGVEDELNRSDSISFILTDVNSVGENCALYQREAGSDKAPTLEIVTDAGTFTLISIEDSYVDSVKSDQNFGAESKSRLMICNGGTDPERESFLKFDLTSVTGTVISATLKLMRRTATTTIRANTYVGVYCNHDNSWGELTITWNNRFEGTVTGNSYIDASEMSLNVYPNPTNGAFTVDGSGIAGKSVSLSVVDMRGVVLYSKDINGKTIINSDRSFAPGLYFVSIHSGDYTDIKKLIIR